MRAWGFKTLGCGQNFKVIPLGGEGALKRYFRHTGHAVVAGWISRMISETPGVTFEFSSDGCRLSNVLPSG